MITFSTLDPGGEDAVILKRFPDLFGERAVNASLAVEGGRVTAGTILDQVYDDGQMTTEASIVPKSVRLGLRLLTKKGLKAVDILTSRQLLTF